MLRQSLQNKWNLDWLHVKVLSLSAQIWNMAPQNCKFYQIWGQKCSIRAHPLGTIFTKFSEFVGNSMLVSCLMVQIYWFYRSIVYHSPCLDPWVSSPTLTTSQPCPRSTTSILTSTQTTHSSTTAAHSSTPSLCETA